MVLMPVSAAFSVVADTLYCLVSVVLHGFFFFNLQNIRAGSCDV